MSMKHLNDAAEILETLRDTDFDAIDLPLLVGALATIQRWAASAPELKAHGKASMCDSFRAQGQRLIEEYEQVLQEERESADDEIVLRIYRAPSGQWAGKLFAGGEEVGGVAGCESPEAVEQQAYDSSIFPSRIERT